MRDEVLLPVVDIDIDVETEEQQDRSTFEGGNRIVKDFVHERYVVSSSIIFNFPRLICCNAVWPDLGAAK